MSKKKSHGGGFVSAVVLISLLYVIGSHTGKQEVNLPEDTPYQVTSLVMDSDDVDEMIRRLEDKFNVKVSEDNKDEFLMLYSIFDNGNLSAAEKNTFYGYYSIILDNPYLNREEAYRSLSKVKVDYGDRDSSVAQNVLGEYEFGDYTIHIYDKEYTNSVLLHEGVHCLYTNSKTAGLPTYFNEGMTELLVNEYFSFDPFYEGVHYPYEVAYVKMLNELVGSDTVLKAFSTGDFSLITNEIQKYNNTPFSTYKILNLYENAFFCEDKKGVCPYNHEDQVNAYNYLGEIAKAAGKNNSDFRYFYELSGSIFEENSAEYYAEYIVNHGVLEKAYFSSDLKKDYSSTIYKRVNDRDKVYSHSFTSKFDK